MGFRILTVLVAALATSAGCVELLPDEDDAATLLLTYTLYDTSPTEEGRGADPGEHCGTARVEGEKAVVERDALKVVGSDRPFLIVDPALDGNWATIGTEGFPMALPAVVDPGIYGDDEPVAVIDWRTEGNRTYATVDGQPVELPHKWQKTHEPDEWLAELRLEMGPDRVTTFRMNSCA